MAELETCLPKGIDRISSLPMPLISRILSLLPIQNAVATSLLSTKWRYFWTSITNLDIVALYFSYPSSDMKMISKLFTQFVNMVLLQLNSHCIQKFHLELFPHNCCDPFYVNSWICAAFRRTAQELHLNIERDKLFELQLSRFYCNSTLVILKLEGSFHFNIDVSSSIFFPNLQTLYLHKVTFTIAGNCSFSFPCLKDLNLKCVKYANEESVNKLLASCPVLDILDIEIDGPGKVRCLTIAIPSLRILNILSHGLSVDGYVPNIDIDAPALNFLCLGSSSNVYSSSGNLSSLLEARLDCSFEKYTTAYAINIFKFLGAIFNVKDLAITGDIFKVIRSLSTTNSSLGFRNLTRLELKKNFCLDWSIVVGNLLENMDNLEHLVMKGKCWGDHESWWTEPLHVPMCLLHRVTTISFVDMFGDCFSELELIRYLLKNAKVLQHFTVHIRGGSKVKLKVIPEISMMPRGSHECEVSFEGSEEEDLLYAFRFL